MSGKTILIWFRNDLRIHDNEILLEAVKRSEKVLPVYCFDPRYFSETRFGTKTTGGLRARFLIESVSALRQSLQQLGGDLIVRIGRPEELLPEICSEYQVSEVYHHREVADRETEISGLVEEALWKKQINLKHFIGHTLYHKEDLPFPIRNIPNDFAVFRKKVERDSEVKPCFDTPQKIKVPAITEAGSIPEPENLGLDPDETISNGHGYTGGEQEGLERLNKVLFGQPDPNEKNSGLFSSQLSPWLSLGCLSAREVYWAVKNNKTVSSALSSKIIFDLQWRDYFRFMLKKHGSSMLGEKESDTGLQGAEYENFVKWQKGETGVPLVDVCIQELNDSGYINDKCKHFVGSYLVNELAVNWRAGAAYLEEKSIDFSPASSWGSWAYIIGDQIMSLKKPLVVKPEEISAEISIKNRLSLLKPVN